MLVFFPTSVSRCVYNTVNVTGTDTRRVFFPPCVCEATRFSSFSLLLVLTSKWLKLSRVSTDIPVTLAETTQLRKPNNALNASPLSAWKKNPSVELRGVCLHTAGMKKDPRCCHFFWTCLATKYLSKWYFHRGGEGWFLGSPHWSSTWLYLAQSWDSGSK